MPDNIQTVQDRLVASMNPERKLLVSESLRRTAWALKAAWIRDQHPELSEADVRERVRQLFLRAGL